MGFEVTEGYGLTETSPVLTANPRRAVRLGSVGKPLPGVEVEVRPVEGAEPGAGEICVRGPNVISGYRNSEASAAALRDGWFCTGDVGRLDAEGYLHLGPVGGGTAQGGRRQAGQERRRGGAAAPARRRTGRADSSSPVVPAGSYVLTFERAPRRRRQRSRAPPRGREPCRPPRWLRSRSRAGRAGRRR